MTALGILIGTWLLGVAWLAWLAATAPVGWQDDHRGVEP